MMLTVKTVKGVIRNGKVEPSEGLDAPEGTEVIISVPSEPKLANGKQMTFGVFAKGPGRQSTAQQFQEAKAFWEREWERSWNRLEKP